MSSRVEPSEEHSGQEDDDDDETDQRDRGTNALPPRNFEVRTRHGIGHHVRRGAGSAPDEASRRRWARYRLRAGNLLELAEKQESPIMVEVTASDWLGPIRTHICARQLLTHIWESAVDISTTPCLKTAAAVHARPKGHGQRTRYTRARSASESSTLNSTSEKPLSTPRALDQGLTLDENKENDVSQSGNRPALESTGPQNSTLLLDILRELWDHIWDITIFTDIENRYVVALSRAELDLPNIKEA
ncbi:uncharacterized protein PG986_008426 [Apiospora aurea]|uniref:Uncharacterized protein n=1 Tax=Apiospora aurea TaxID=335848 RepID=A0ABR1QFR3_9PEZI